MLPITYAPLTLELRTTFRIAHGASDQRHNVLVRIAEGVGEAAAVAYHGETQAGIMAYLAAVGALQGDDPCLLEELLAQLPPGSQAARAGVDIALHDLWGQRLGQPLYRLLGLDPARIPLTSFTIAMDTPEATAERAREAGLPLLKIKVGSEEDAARLAAIRQATAARLRLDANAGWSREQAEAWLPRLADFGIELLEQPLPVGDLEGLRRLRALKTGVPIFADESVKTARDVAAHAGAVDGVVIKLMKTGGIREALRAIHTARAHDMQVMLSCMVESSVGVTAAAHLAPLCDAVDLDGPLLVKNDPFEGLRYEGARLLLPDRPGIGVVVRNQAM